MRTAFRISSIPGRRQQLLRRSSGAIGRGVAGPEGVTCVRSKNGSRTISVLERQGVITFGKPEVSLELISQDTGLPSDWRHVGGVLGTRAFITFAPSVR